MVSGLILFCVVHSFVFEGQEKRDKVLETRLLLPSSPLFLAYVIYIIHEQAGPMMSQCISLRLRFGATRSAIVPSVCFLANILPCLAVPLLYSHQLPLLPSAPSRPPARIPSFVDTPCAPAPSLEHAAS